MITPLHPNLQKVSTEKLGAAFQEILYDNLWELYEQTPEQETYITAAQARELGVGKAEMLVFNDWLLCGVGCAYISNYMGEPLKYRTIKQAQPVSWNTKYSDSTPKLSVGNSAFEDWFQSQPFATQTGIKQMCRDSYAAGMGDPLVTYVTTRAQPEPVDPDDVRIELVVALNSLASDFEIATYSMQKGSEDRANAEGAIAHAMKIHAKHNQNGRIFKNETKPIDPHATLRAEYAKQVREGTTGFYLWEAKDDTALECFGWMEVPIPYFYMSSQYRCKDISCYVSKDGEPAIRMLRTEAQELQRSLGDTVEWSYESNDGRMFTGYATNSKPISFGYTSGVYIYRTRATIKLDGKRVTPEQAAAVWESKKETHTCINIDCGDPAEVMNPAFDGLAANGEEYELRPKSAIKQIKWNDMPVGVAVQDNATNVVWLLQGVGDGIDVILANHPQNPFGMRWADTSCIKLAHASKQPWIPTIAPHEGLVVEYSKFSECMKITGIAKGYKMEGAV